MTKLYNNLRLPEKWPPEFKEETLDKPIQPLDLDLESNIVDIKIGRQLFVDDFLIENKTNIHQIFHKASLDEKPVFFPETELEMNDGFCPCASPFNDGVFYDEEEQIFKMWYQAGWFEGIGYATSKDGLKWERKKEISLKSLVAKKFPTIKTALRDGAAVWIDYEAKTKAEKHKMMIFFRLYDQEIDNYINKPKQPLGEKRDTDPIQKILLFQSANGMDWELVSEAGEGGDNTTFFYNPFTKKWVYSIRSFSDLDSRVRVRSYYETDNFFEGSKWQKNEPKFWSRTDKLDKPDPQFGYFSQLYNLDATPYESIMLGMFGIFLGPPNEICKITKMPKIIDLSLAYSRDGFSWHRPDREAFIASSREKGSWNYGYAHSSNGICIVKDDELLFYTTFFSGQSPKLGTHKYAGGNVGLARLRRDGFVSLTNETTGEGYITTKKLAYEGEYLYLNCNASTGTISCELMDVEENTIPGFERELCCPVREDSTKIKVHWKNQNKIPDLDALKIKFYIEDAHIYSFWISDERGKSRGYCAAGGPNLVNAEDKD